MSPTTSKETALGGRVFALMQARHAEVLAQLITRRGGAALSAPCMREVRVDDPSLVGAALREVIGGKLRLAIFQTGVGVRDLFEIAGELKLSTGLSERLASATVLARGPKPLAALHQRAVEVHLRTEAPHTTDEVVAALNPLAAELEGELVLLQHFGATNSMLDRVLRGWGAHVVDLFPYVWGLPEDLEPVRHFLRELAAGRVDATVFTSSPQVENLWTVAEQLGEGAELAGWLGSKTVVASVGPTTTRALESRGVSPRIQPVQPKMVPLVDAIGDFYASA